MTMYRNLTATLVSILAGGLIFPGAVMAAADNDEKAAQEAVKKVVKNPESLKWGQFSLAGAKGACLTVYTQNSLSKLVGSNEAFLIRKGDGWEALYIAEIPSGHKGCVEEMSKR